LKNSKWYLFGSASKYLKSVESLSQLFGFVCH
jgi:hypothetical protein